MDMPSPAVLGLIGVGLYRLLRQRELRLLGILGSSHTRSSTKFALQGFWSIWEEAKLRYGSFCVGRGLQG